MVRLKKRRKIAKEEDSGINERKIKE